MENVLEKLFTYVAEGVDEDPTTYQRKDALHVVTEKQQLLGSIHGKQKILEEKGYVRSFITLV